MEGIVLNFYRESIWLQIFMSKKQPRITKKPFLAFFVFCERFLCFCDGQDYLSSLANSPYCQDYLSSLANSPYCQDYLSSLANSVVTRFPRIIRACIVFSAMNALREWSGVLYFTRAKPLIVP